jgi:hypothetical protein
MTWLWTWGGKCFGYRDGDDLWTYDGQHVGRFHGDEIYGRDGRYLGEVMNESRLITNKAKGAGDKAASPRMDVGVPMLGTLRIPATPCIPGMKIFRCRRRSSEIANRGQRPVAERLA